MDGVELQGLQNFLTTLTLLGSGFPTDGRGLQMHTEKVSHLSSGSTINTAV